MISDHQKLLGKQMLHFWKWHGLLPPTEMNTALNSWRRGRGARGRVLQLPKFYSVGKISLKVQNFEHKTFPFRRNLEAKLAPIISSVDNFQLTVENCNVYFLDLWRRWLYVFRWSGCLGSIVDSLSIRNWRRLAECYRQPSLLVKQSITWRVWSVWTVSSNRHSLFTPNCV